MLTILWRKPDGSELLFAADSLERTAGKESQIPAGGGFIARGVTDDRIPGSEFHFDIAEPFGAVFVMNEKGATVARYLDRPPSSELTEAA